MSASAESRPSAQLKNLGFLGSRPHHCESDQNGVQQRYNYTKSVLFSSIATCDYSSINYSYINTLSNCDCITA
jgi:hypothetical protein